MSRIEHTTLRFRADDPELRSRLVAAATDLLAAYEAPRLVVRLDGDDLPDTAVQGLIAALRRLREDGGALAVVPENQSIAAALAVRGLDRVLAFPLDAADMPAPKSGGRPSRFVRAATAVLAGAVGLSATVAADAQTHDAAVPSDPAAIIAKVMERNPALSSYQGRLHVNLKMSSFPWLHQHLDGTTYFKRPSQYEVVFDKVPSYAKGFERLFADIGDPAHWPSKFTITNEGEKPYEHRDDVQLRMVQKVRGMIDHEDVLIDPKSWAVDRVDYYYYNGGHIAMTQTFREVAGHSLLATQEADIDIPHVRAVAEGTYDGYRTNVAIDDSVFVKGQKQ